MIVSSRRDFAARDAHRFEQVLVRTRPCIALAEIALQKLEMDVERVERIAQLMRDAGGEQRDGVELLRFDRFAGLRAARGQVVENNGEAHQRGVLVLQRHEIKIQVALLGIEDLQVAIHHAALGQDRRPVEFLEMLRDRRAHRLGRIDAEQRGDGMIEIENPPWESTTTMPSCSVLKIVSKKPFSLFRRCR